MSLPKTWFLRKLTSPSRLRSSISCSTASWGYSIEAVDKEWEGQDEFERCHLNRRNSLFFLTLLNQSFQIFPILFFLNEPKYNENLSQPPFERREGHLWSLFLVLDESRKLTSSARSSNCSNSSESTSWMWKGSEADLLYSSRFGSEDWSGRNWGLWISRRSLDGSMTLVLLLPIPLSCSWSILSKELRSGEEKANGIEAEMKGSKGGIFILWWEGEERGWNIF